MKNYKLFVLLILSLVCATVHSQRINSQKEKIRAALEYQREHYPVSQYRDVYKNFMQDFFGPGHLLSDTAAAAKYLQHEIATTSEMGGPDYEPTGFEGHFYRVNIRLIVDGTIPYDIYFDAFVRSVQAIQPPDSKDWMETWRVIDEQIADMGWKFENESQDRHDLAEQFSQGNFIAHHSKAFNQANKFHYRIISRDNFLQFILPIIRAGSTINSRGKSM